MGDLSEHFDKREFACKCCGTADVDMALVEALEKLRRLVDKPINILSGYRCPRHNAEVDGARFSFHVEGKAADIRVSGMSVDDIIYFAKKIPEFEQGGIGRYVNSGFVHVDVRDYRARWEG